MAFLETIVNEKRREVAAKRAARPPESLREAATDSPVRDFHAAVARPGAIIAELKTRTPTIPSFLHSHSLPALTQAYARGGAAAISIVTDAARFGTSLEDIGPTRELVSLPVLAKDFVIDPYQVVEARAAGADAVLLIVRLLDFEELHSLLDLAGALGMSALVEAHDESEMLAALAAGARIIGVNNRDLDTMSVSLDTTRRVAHLVPRDVVLVAESGIRSRAEIDELSLRGAGAFLVGRSLLDAPDPEAKLRELTRKTDPLGEGVRR